MLSALLWLLAATALAQAPASPAAVPAPEIAGKGASTPGTTVPAAEAVPGGGEADAALGAEPNTESTVALTQEELETLGFGTGEGPGAESGVDTDLHVSGFLDFGVSKLIAKKGSLVRGFLANRTSFYVGNFNLYLSKNLSKSFRTMGEVRFLYKPNGSAPFSDGTGTPTTETEDHADFDRPLRWGGVEIERAYLEWSAHRFLTIRLGQFLTPYGIWNVDHGSPTFIPVQRPYVVGDGLFPERQTGFELFGRWDATRHGTLGYHLTLSNGQGPISEYRDLDENKAIGARLFWERHGAGTLKFGGSAYYGRNTDGTTTITANPTGSLQTTDVVYQQYDVLALALDAAWRYQGLLLQAEWITQQRAFTKRGRSAVPEIYGTSLILPSDALTWGAYGLAGYRLPWFGIMPYFVAQYFDSTTINGTRSQIVNMQGGLNIRPIDAVVFKLEYSYAFFTKKLLGRDDPIQYFQAQAAWAF